MADLSTLSDQDLKQLYQIQKQESNNAPDSSTVTSSAGASGNMQVMPATGAQPGFGIKPSNGSPEDTARVGRDLFGALKDHYGDATTAAIAYNWGSGNTDKWIARGSNPAELPDETLKYAHDFSTSQAGQATPPPQQPTQPAGPDYSKMSDEELKAEYAKQNPPSAAKQRGLAAIQAMRPDVGAMGGALTGLGETGAQMATGMFGQAAGALHGGAVLAGGGTYEQAKQALEQEREPVTYQPRTQAGIDISNNVGQMFDKYLTQPLEKGGQIVGEAAGLTPTEAQHFAEVGTSLFENIGLPGLMGGIHGVKAGEVKAPGVISELDKLNAANAPETPPEFVGPPRDITMGPNAGPPQQFVVNERGIASRPNEPVSMEQAGAEMGRELYGSKLEEKRLAETPAREYNTVEARAGAIAEAPIEHSDPTSDIPHPQENIPSDRAAAPEEFRQAVTTLAEKAPDKFSVPADMDRAYEQYSKIVAGDMTPGPMADRFAKAVGNMMADQRVENHPVIKANQARVNHFQAQLADAESKRAPTSSLQKQLDRAQQTLDKSKANIAKELGTDPYTPKVKDGVVQMYTFGHLPSVMKSIGAVLKSLHGVVFKSLDKLLPSFRNLDTRSQIIGQGIKDFVNKQATKEWSQNINEQPRQVLSGVDGLRQGLKDYLPDAPELSPQELKTQMQSVPDIIGGKVRSALRNNLLTGQQMQAFTHHPLVKYAVNTVDAHMRAAGAFVRDQLTGKDGLRNKARAMSDDEMTGIWSLLEMNEGSKEFTPSELKSKGYSDKQIDFYQKRQQLNDQKLQALNVGRAEAGLPPVDRRIAHIAGHFLGDFKRVIRDADGNVKAVIAHNSRGAVNVITKRVMDQLGEGHEAGPIEMRKLTEGNNADRYTGYMNILNDMSSRDPVVDKVVQAYKDYMSKDAQAAMKYRAAFKSKEGVIGAEGRKSWESAKQNAKVGIQNELKALEAMNTWSEMQKALGKIKQFQADPEINAPNAKGMVQSYLDNVQHRNQGMAASFSNSLINGFAEVTGVGPTALRKLSAQTKTGLLTMFIGLGKLSHSFVTSIQPLQGIPVVNSLMKAEGAKLGSTQLTSVLKSMGSQVHLLEALAKGSDVTDPFVRKALQFAKANDTLNTSQFQFGNLTDINRNQLASTAHKIAEFNVTGMETATRAFTYMYYSHMLKDLGMNESEIFPTAHNAMKDVMVDYNAWERPGVFGKLGFLGDLTAMLTRYKFNQIDQFARASKYLGQGQLGPMLTIMTTSIAAAGVRGIMAYTLANKLVQATTTWAAQNNLMDKPTSIDELLLHALHGKNENLSNAVKFGLPSALGLNLTGSLSHADDIPNDPLGSLIPQSTPIMDMAKSAYNFARDPNKATLKTAAYDMAPNSAKGMLENRMFTDPSGRFTNPHSYELQTIRTPTDQTKRTFGFRPLNEANESLTTQVGREQAKNEGEVKQDIIERILRDVDSNKGVTPKLQQDLKDKYIPKYLANNGNPDEIVKAIVEHQGIGQARTAAERAQGIPKGSLQSIFNYERYQNLK